MDKEDVVYIQWNITLPHELLKAGEKGREIREICQKRKAEEAGQKWSSSIRLLKRI